MKTAMLLLSLSVLPYVSASASCGDYTVSRMIGSSRIFTSNECKTGAPLSLTHGPHDYPLLGSMKVGYWRGNFFRAARETDTYEYDTYDREGNLINTWTQKRSFDLEIKFSVDNPNLHDDVDKTFIANAPMTDDEAKTAWIHAKQDCESAKDQNTGDHL